MLADDAIWLQSKKKSFDFLFFLTVLVMYSTCKVS